MNRSSSPSSPFSPGRKKRGAGLSSADSAFNAWDCSRPLNLTTVTTQSLTCLEGNEPTTGYNNASYLLVQRVDRIPIALQHCLVKLYVIPFVCGWHSHSTSIPFEQRFDEEYRISKAECRTAWEEGTFLGHEVKPNKTVHIAVPSGYGGTSFPDGGWDVHCQGHYFPYYNGANWAGHVSGNDRGVAINHLYITLTEELGLLDDDSDSVMAFYNQVHIPCKQQNEGCVVEDHGTYLWRAPEIRNKCPYFSTRSVSGIETYDRSGNHLFVSQDGSMIRLAKKEAVSQCGSVLYTTDYGNLFLTPFMDHPQFKRKLPERHMSVTTYVNHQDSFVYHNLLDTIEEEVSAVRLEQCRKESSRRSGEYARKAAEQHAIQDGETTHLGSGLFATAAGEVWYRYRCKRILVQAKTSSECYDALPIMLREEDYRHIVEAQRDQNTSLPLKPEFFLEPRTHRVLTTASVRPCAPPFSPLYKNARGNWVATTGSLLYQAPAPTLIDGTEWLNRTEENFRDFDFEAGGIYTAEDIKRMEQFSQAPRLQQGVISKMTEQAEYTFQPGRPLYGASFFPDMPNQEALSFFDVAGWLWGLFQHYGNFCSAIIGTGLLIKFGVWVTGVVIRLYSPRQPGFGLVFHFVSSIFPSLRDYARDRADGKGQGGIGILRACCGSCHGNEEEERQPLDYAEVQARRTAWLVLEGVRGSGDKEETPAADPPSQTNKVKTVSRGIYPHLKNIAEERENHPKTP
jgi:hypothetical protein